MGSECGLGSLLTAAWMGHQQLTPLSQGGISWSEATVLGSLRTALTPLPVPSVVTHIH